MPAPLTVTVLADGVPIDCGSIADGLTGCYGGLPAVGIAAAAALGGAAVLGHTAFALLFPKLLNMLTGVPTAAGTTESAASTAASAASTVASAAADVVVGRRWDNPKTTVRGGTYYTPPTPRLRDLINPRRGETNCRACVIAVEAALTGAPATALPNIKSGPADVLERHFGSRFRPITLSGIVEEMTKAGHGARGIVLGIKPRYSHVFNVINNRGRVVFLDGQAESAGDVTRWRYYQLMRTN